MKTTKHSYEKLVYAPEPMKTAAVITD